MILLIIACTDDPSPAESADTTTETLLPITVEDAWVDRMEGRWLGAADPTPYGAIDPFPMDFTREDDGALYSRTDAGDGDYIDLRFRSEDGAWVLDEEARISGSVQGYTAHPVSQSGDAIQWLTLDDPDFLVIDVTPADDHLTIQVSLRGEPHVTFEMER